MITNNGLDIMHDTCAVLLNYVSEALRGHNEHIDEILKAINVIDEYARQNLNHDSGTQDIVLKMIDALYKVVKNGDAVEALTGYFING